MARSSTSGLGRPKGIPNKNTSEIKALAQEFGPDAIFRLAELGGVAPDPSDPTGKTKLKGAASEDTQARCIKELLDRGYGRATQPISGPDGEGPVVTEVIYRWAAPGGE